MTIKPVSTSEAPEAVGPYSQAVCAGGLIYCSGQIPLDPKTGTMIEGNIQEQTRQVLENLKQVLSQADSDFTKVVKVNIFLKDLSNFALVNEVYASYFNEPYPARATVEVARLPLDAEVEIDLVALQA